MLAPERAEHAGFQAVGISPDAPDDRTVFILIESHRCQLGPVDNGRH